MLEVAIDKFVKITQKDPEWTQTGDDGGSCPRAELRIADDCPAALKHHIQDAIQRGYLQVDAFVPEAQIALEMLGEKNG